MGLRQAPDDDGLCSVPGALGQEAILEGDGSVVSNIVRQSVPSGRSRGDVGLSDLQNHRTRPISRAR